MSVKNGGLKSAYGVIKAAFGPYKRQIAGTAIISFASGIFEGVGINAVIPVFSIIQGGRPSDLVSRSIEKFFLFFGLPYTVKYLLIFIILLFILRAALYFFARFITAKITADYENKVRNKLFRATLWARWPYLLRQKLGHLDQIMTTDVDRGSAFLFHIGSATIVVATLAVYTFVAFNLSFVITALAVVAGGTIFLVLKPLFYKSKVLAQRNADKRKELAHFLNENVLGARSVKSFYVQNEVYKKGEVFFENLRALYLRLSIIGSFINSVVQPLGLFFVVGIFAFFYKTGSFNFTSFAVIVYAINKIFTGIQLTQASAHTMSSLFPHLANVVRYEEEAEKNLEKTDGEEVFKFFDSLELKNIKFSYYSKQEALSNISFSVKKGETIGLIGPSGSGKTTIVDLLLRLFEPESGQIFLDGQNIEKISLPEWRSKIAYVSQDIFLLNDTIKNNIRFYKDSVGDKDIEDASRMANIYDFIQTLPNKFATVSGERGIELSGGQRQRIVLARALARKPEILILDEATSALDNESELLIQKAVEELKKKTTMIIIAHRLSTVMVADKLVVVSGGKVIEEGSPEKLLTDKDSYFFKAYNIRK